MKKTATVLNEFYYFSFVTKQRGATGQQHLNSEHFRKPCGLGSQAFTSNRPLYGTSYLFSRHLSRLTYNLEIGETIRWIDYVQALKKGEPLKNPFLGQLFRQR